jgi:hypothetical protein
MTLPEPDEMAIHSLGHFLTIYRDYLLRPGSVQLCIINDEIG